MWLITKPIPIFLFAVFFLYPYFFTVLTNPTSLSFFIENVFLVVKFGCIMLVLTKLSHGDVEVTINGAKSKLLSAVPKLLSAVLKLLSVVLKLLSAMLKLLSAVLKLLSAVPKLLSAVLKLLSAVLKLLSAVLKWRSTITGLDQWTGLVDWTSGLTRYAHRRGLALETKPKTLKTFA